MVKNICVVTGTRAEYHLLYPLILALKKESEFHVRLAVTGSHLSEKYGYTVRDIENDGLEIDDRIPILDDGDSTSDINRAMSRAIVGFDAAFRRNRPDMVILLGDRYELLSTAIVCMNGRIPIAHLHGGETTEGAVDECIRHAITKMSYLHFTSCEAYRRRVIQLGENPARVFNVGAIGLENILNAKRMSLIELNRSLRAELGSAMRVKLGGNFAVFTLHPVTLEKPVDEERLEGIFTALDGFPDLQILFTKANADAGGLVINDRIDRYVAENAGRCLAVFSLGLTRYLSALSMARVVIGNSSSGILETPSFGVPTVNIGNRQRGRIQAENIINSDERCESVTAAIRRALSPDFLAISRRAISPYGDGHVTEKIVRVLKDCFAEDNIDLEKRFFDLSPDAFTC